MSGPCVSQQRNPRPDGPLHGYSVLVVEDHFLLAEDLRRLLDEAGLAVVGPFPDAKSAIAAVGEHNPTCALININMGDGRDFELARALLARGVPVLFVTGYDADAIPSELSHLPHLQKPATQEEILAAIAGLCSDQAAAIDREPPRDAPPP